jgi:phosphonate transport system substrate-binding protein
MIDESKVRVLGYSDPFPQYPWAMRNSLDEALQERIKQAFYALDDAEILAQLKAEGIAPITDADYDVVRNLKQSLDL